MQPSPSAWNRRKIVTTVLALGLGSSAGSSAACRGPQATETGAPAPATGGSSGPPPQARLPDAPASAQELTLQVVDGRFPAIRFNVQPGPVRLNVNARGGPYTLQIETLLAPQRIPPDTTTLIGFTATSPGEYLMELMGEQKTETAILDVRPASAR